MTWCCKWCKWCGKCCAWCCKWCGKCCWRWCIKDIIRWALVSQLKWADIVAEYTLFVLMFYIKDKMGLTFVIAAVIINIWMGLSKILTLACAFLVDNAKLGNHTMVLCSSIAYSIGLTFLWMSTPPVLDNVAGNCKDYTKNCFGPVQKAMLCISLLLIVVGRAGHNASLDPFLDELNDKKPGKNEGSCTIKNLANKLVSVSISCAIAIALPDDKLDIRFGVAAVFTIMATIAFFIGTSSTFYQNSEPKEVGDTIDFSDMFHQTAPVWLSFIMCGVVSSIGNTFFVEQANNMKSKNKDLDHISISILLFLSNYVAKPIIEYSHGFGYQYVMKPCVRCFARKDLAAVFGIGMAMLSAIMCCATAAIVENERHRGIGKDNIFFLVPQFLFLTSLDAMFQQCVKDFFQDIASQYSTPAPQEQAHKDYKVSQPLEKYTLCITNFVIGLGFMGSVITVLAAANISKSVSTGSWFQEDIDDPNSHLDRYYWTLATLSAISFIWYVVAVACYKVKNPPK